MKSGWVAAMRMSEAGWCRCVRSTYRQGDFAALGDFFGEDSEKVEDAGVAGDFVAEGRDHGGEHVLPRLHLDGQDGEAHA